MFKVINEKYNYIEFFENIIEQMGGVYKGQKDYVFRKNVDNPSEKGTYFGCISKDEASKGVFSDLCIVIFPSNEADEVNDRWIISLAVGSLGYKNDYNIASLPGTRRAFVKHLSKDSYIKNDFTDVLSREGFLSFCKKAKVLNALKKSINDMYGKVILACSLIDPNDKAECEKQIERYLALYANLRGWPTNATHRKKVNSVLLSNKNTNNDEDAIKNLLKLKKYVVLQGAPGTGKTYMAKKIAESENPENIFFTQFHAETSYSDFIYGIRPRVNSKELGYEEYAGVFVKAIKKAQQSEKDVYLIIDEINRANLSNVLGPAFYLFEPLMSESNIKIKVCPGVELAKLPDNLYVIATMNTSDRSLAIVDFALRRRFAWYTLRPQVLKDEAIEPDQVFCDAEFNEISEIFEKYALDEELNLQPGPAYFIVSKHSKEEAIKTRLLYEIMPLIKEYLIDGMLSRAKDDFINYFREKIGEEMFY